MVGMNQPGRIAVMVVLVSGIFVCGCGKGSTISSVGGGGTPSIPMPSIATTPAQNSAVIVTLTPPGAGDTILYTLDGSTPDQNSSQTMTYEGPFLVASDLKLEAVATSPGTAGSAVLIVPFNLNISSGTLVWSEEFSNSTSNNVSPIRRPGPTTRGPIAAATMSWRLIAPGARPRWVAIRRAPTRMLEATGILHIVARSPLRPAVYTSARLKTQGLFSFQYGRIEARMKLPESQGMWPAFWLLGNNIATVNWPACGELDVMEHINGSNPQNEGYDWIQGSIHGTNLNGGIQYHRQASRPPHGTPTA